MTYGDPNMVVRRQKQSRIVRNVSDGRFVSVIGEAKGVPHATSQSGRRHLYVFASLVISPSVLVYLSSRGGGGGIVRAALMHMS